MFNNIILYMDKVSVYYLDPLYFRCDLLMLVFKKKNKQLISALLRDLQKMAASKPISCLYSIKTSFISLNNNFGTLLILV